DPGSAARGFSGGELVAGRRHQGHLGAGGMMLARTAGDLFWLARYMERADYVARLLQVAGHMNAVRVDSNRSSEWESALVAAGCEEGLEASGQPADETSVIQFLAFDRANPSSIANCIETARRNARSVRTTLTTEM